MSSDRKRKNSFDKIVHSYFAAVTKQPFVYEGVTVPARRVIVSPLLFRGFQCHAKCGACCQRYSLEYLPTEVHPSSAEKYYVTVNGVVRALYRVEQPEKEQHCQHLDLLTGMCKIQEEKPFHCDFELIRPMIGADRVKWIQKLPGRHWCMKRIPGEGKGALCKITPPTEATTREVIRKLKRLKEWTDHFGLETWLPEMIEWAARGPYNKSLILVTPEQATALLEVR
jgi:hypothetical protein